VLVLVISRHTITLLIIFSSNYWPKMCISPHASADKIFDEPLWLLFPSRPIKTRGLGVLPGPLGQLYFIVLIHHQISFYIFNKNKLWNCIMQLYYISLTDHTILSLKVDEKIHDIAFNSPIITFFLFYFLALINVLNAWRNLPGWIKSSSNFGSRIMMIALDWVYVWMSIYCPLLISFWFNIVE
jgi:hypothetical protein